QTFSGKSEALQAKLGDLSNAIGEKLIPGLDDLADKGLAVMAAFDGDSPMTLADRLSALGDMANTINPMMWGTNALVATQRDLLNDAAKAAGDAAGALDTYAEKNAAAREPTAKLNTANKNLSGSLGLVAQTGAAAAAAVQDEIDALYESNWLNGRGKGTTRKSTGSTNRTGDRSGGGATPHAAGGWVGLNGPEVSLLGERGPEWVVPNHQLGTAAGGSAGSPVQINVQVDGKTIARIVDRNLYYRAQRKPT
ncbi:MAG: hypothetical protein WCI74_21330, partial [Actinomycetes bacterium]